MTKSKNILTLLIILLTLLLPACSSNVNSNIMNVHYIDVGQGDSILIQVNNKNLLIDAGPSQSQDDLVAYIKNLGIKNLDYIIATHPHEDHIGGMAKVIKSFNIGKFYAPNVIHNSNSFENMVFELKNKKLKINVIKKGMGNDINLGDNTKVEVFSPISDTYDNLNNYSPIMKITYGNTSFLFTGDAESEVENQVLQDNVDIKSNVLKVGHHGSSSSTSEIFFDAVSPNLSIISLGINNKYGHPHKNILSLLTSKNTEVYRTDEDGTIIISSDGNTLNIK